MCLVHRYEPLRRRAEDHGVLATPTVRVTVVVLFTEDQHPTFAHELDDLIVGIEHTLAREKLHFWSETPGIVDWTVDLQTVALADYEVVVTVTRSCMNTTSTGFAVRRFLLCLTNVEFCFSISFAPKRDVFADHQQRRTIDPRMATLESVEFGTLETGQHFWSVSIAVIETALRRD